MFRRFKLFLLALFCFFPDALQARDREINTLEDFKYLVYMEDWRAHLSWVRGIEDTPKWCKNVKGKFEESLVDYIPSKIAELATGTGVFKELSADYKGEKPEYFTFSDKFENFSGANWNAFVCVNLLSALYLEQYRYEYEDYAQNEEVKWWENGIEIVGRRLKDKLGNKYNTQLDDAVSDISIYAKALHLYDYVHKMVQFRDKYQDETHLSPDSSDCYFSEEDKSGNFEIRNSTISYGKEKEREKISGSVKNGKFIGYITYNSKISDFALGDNKEEDVDPSILYDDLGTPIITIDRNMRVIPLKSSDAQQGDEISVEEVEEDEHKVETSLNESLRKNSINEENEEIEYEEENSDYERKIIWKELFSDQLQENSLNRRHVSADYKDDFQRLFRKIFDEIKYGGMVNDRTLIDIEAYVPDFVEKVCASKSKCIKDELSTKVQYLYGLLDGKKEAQGKIEKLFEDVPNDPDESIDGFNDFKSKAIGALEGLQKLNQEKLFVDDEDAIADINGSLEETKGKLSSINLPATLPAFASDLAQNKKPDVRTVLELLNSANGTEIARIVMDYLSRVERVHRCEKCKKEDRMEENTFVLQVPTKHETIQECIAVAETADKTICPACKSESEWECTTKFLDLPKMLLVSLNRNEKAQKLLEGFYKERLFLSDKNGEKEYSLAAVIRTQPDNNKLYDIRVKNSDGKWYNISSSGDVSQNDFAFDENAYILFYDQVN